MIRYSDCIVWGWVLGLGGFSWFWLFVGFGWELVVVICVLDGLLVFVFVLVRLLRGLVSFVFVIVIARLVCLVCLFGVCLF